ncbi:uncharacterized protein LOC135824971 [Sycon ciliatum]|uniref:uncharacterized protein LOC135824971 n=1 Tax=Sycon ciliatum TaxID=27933 RepID=UPI0031F65119
MYAIGGAEQFTMPPSHSQLELIAKNFRFIQGSSNTKQQAYMRQVNPAFRPVQYFMTHTAPSNHLEHIAASLETVLMYAAGLLAQAINSSGSDATLNALVDEKHSLLKSSTQPGTGLIGDARTGCRLLDGFCLQDFVGEFQP